jgi:signal transduction histidine kinase
MSVLISAAISEITDKTSSDSKHEVILVAELVAQAAKAAGLFAQDARCAFTIAPVDPEIEIEVDRERILGAIANLLQNAFKFTAAGSEVALSATVFGSFVRIDIRDHCGGLPQDSIERLFSPFTQRSSDKSGLGLGLSIARHNIELDGGTLSVRNLPGSGCVFTVSLPRREGVRLA